MLVRKTALAIIIQDVHAQPGFFSAAKTSLRSFSERLALALARFFDLILPVSAEIIENFRFAKNRCIVFQGGVTEFAKDLLKTDGEKLQDFGVFAGALEPHNGIDRLVAQWVACGVRHPLHIFGRGSLKHLVEAAARESNLIVYHGLQPEATVIEWQRKALWNMCLRYSEGLNQKYFFPSKFFNILCAPGVVVVNNFYGIPDDLRGQSCIVANDLSDLGLKLQESAALLSSERLKSRRDIVCNKYSWKACVSEILHTLSGGKLVEDSKR